MALNLPSLDIDLLSVRRIIPFQYGYVPYNSNIMFVTDSNGELKGIGLDQYFSTYGIITPSSIAPSLQAMLISTSYFYTISSVSTIAYATNSTIINAMWPSTNAYLYSTILSTTISTILRVDGDVSTLSSFVRFNNANPGTSSLSTNIASLSNIMRLGFSTLSTTIGQVNISTLCTFNIALSNGLISVNPGVGLSSMSTSMSQNFSSLSTALSQSPVGIPGISSLSTVVFTYISTQNNSEGVSTLSTLTFRSFSRWQAGPGLSSVSTVVSQSISTYSTIIGRNPPGITGLSSLSTGVARSFFIWSAGPGLSTLSTILSESQSSFSTSIYTDPPGITGVSSLYLEVALGFSTIACSDGLSSLSTVIGPGFSSVDSSFGLSSLSTSVSLGLSTIACSGGLSTLSTTISLGLSSVATNIALESVSTAVGYGLSTVACSDGLSTLSTTISLGLSTTNVGTTSSFSTYIGTLSTIDISYSGYFDYISTVRPLHRFTDKPALGLNCYPDSAATLDVNGLTRFRSTTYFTDTKVVITNQANYTSNARAELDVSGSIIAENIFINQIGTFGDSVTAQAFLTPSDKRLKDNIRVIEDAISTLKLIRGVRFNWLANNKPDIGCIAQEVEAVFPEAIGIQRSQLKEKEYLVVAYEKLIPVLLESIKELSDRVERIECRINN